LLDLAFMRSVDSSCPASPNSIAPLRMGRFDPLPSLSQRVLAAVLPVDEQASGMIGPVPFGDVVLAFRDRMPRGRAILLPVVTGWGSCLLTHRPVDIGLSFGRRAAGLAIDHRAICGRDPCACAIVGAVAHSHLVISSN
jgi:hypothetical protein